eukprot:scaffold8095_cov75-Phaeocystis_antarctica.AAC.2
MRACGAPPPLRPPKPPHLEGLRRAPAAARARAAVGPPARAVCRSAAGPRWRWPVRWPPTRAAPADPAPH